MRCIVLAGLAACLVPNLASANIVTYNSQSSFAAAAPNATQYAFSGAAADYGSSYTRAPATFRAADIQLFADNLYGPSVTYLEFYPHTGTVTLSPTAYGIGLKLGTYTGGDTIAISVNGVQVTTVTTPAARTPIYVGFVDSDPITTLTLVTNNASQGVDVVNFALSNTPGILVPEPASLLMLGVGALAATALRRRRTA